MNKATHIHSISFHSANSETTKYDKSFQSLLLKINVALNVNVYENLKCKIIYKVADEIKTMRTEINRFENNIIYFESNKQIELKDLIDIKF
jgi:hypothetical protein